MVYDKQSPQGAGKVNKKWRKILSGGAAALLVTVLVMISVSANKMERGGFDITDDPGKWFTNNDGPVGGSFGLDVVSPPYEIDFSHMSKTVHTVTSLIWVTGAANMPFDTGPMKGSDKVVVTTPGLYVFFCEIHPFMFAGVIVDDPNTEGLDLGETITLANGITVPTNSNLALRLLRTFFIATNPDNWQDYRQTTWHVTYPDVDVRITGGAVVNLKDTLEAVFGQDTPLGPVVNPANPGVGEVWVDTQFELTAGKEKPGTATQVDAVTWEVTRKVALPEINMNNPHNMWTDRDQELIFQTEWFDHRLTVFDRETGALVRNISVDEAPPHVITRPDTDQVFVGAGGADRNESVMRFNPRADGGKQRINVGAPFPHGFWITSDGSRLITPHNLDNVASVTNLNTGEVRIVETGHHPIAIGVTPDSAKFYAADFLDSTLTVVDLNTFTVNKVNLLADYDPITGAITGLAVGGLPIQTPVSPDGKLVVTANTLTATITIVDTATDTVVALLPADPGAHGVNFGAKKGGGYYAYVTNKFSNRMIVVDPDPNGDGIATDAVIAGSVLLVASTGTALDATITGNAGQGGQGVLPIPVVYNGWVQNLPVFWSNQLTVSQRNPLP
jgi:DNA-binding beta-propeller fold protein YncE